MASSRGALAGAYVSSLVWLRAERHVVRLVFEHAPGVMQGCWSASDSVAPWHRYVVGAPKKQSKRGEHLKKGGSGYQARLRQVCVGDGDAAAEGARGAASSEPTVATAEVPAAESPSVPDAVGGDDAGGGVATVTYQRTRRIPGMDTSSDEADQAPMVPLVEACQSEDS